MAMPNPALAAKGQAPETPSVNMADRRRQKFTLAAVILGLVLVMALTGFVIYRLWSPETPAENVERLRDIFIIVVAFESLVIGVALTVLIIQLASLINLLQNEVRPILRATSDTVNTLRGTTEFIGENVVQPVIELRGYLAGLNRVLELFRIKR
jgi:4-amino-4-deoxy-L-arabinose transferase-like glycosyltransferase